MKYVRFVLSSLVMAVVVGCGSGDLNKDLKPVDPNAPRPQVGTEKGGQSEKAATPP